MKKIIALLLALALLLSLAACGGETADDPNAGKYQGTTAKAMGMTMDMSEVYPGETWLELKSGGKGTIMLDGDSFSMKWKLEGDTFTLTIDGEDSVGTLANGVIVVDLMGMGVEMTFVKEGTRAPAPAATHDDAGYWEVIRVDSEDPEAAVSEEDMELVKAFGVMMYMELNQDGTGVLVIEEEMAITWQDGSVTFLDDPMTVSYTIENGVMTLDMIDMVFILRKGDASGAANSGSDVQQTGEAGIYEGTKYEYGDLTYDMAEIYKDLCTIELKNDGTALFTLDGQVMECTWTLDGDAFVLTYYSVDSPGTLKDGVITIDYMGTGMLLSFTKADGSVSTGTPDNTDTPDDTASVDGAFPDSFIADHEGDWHGMAIVYDGTGVFEDDVDTEMEIIARLVFREDGSCDPYLACAFGGKDNNFKNLGAVYSEEDDVMVLSGEFVNSEILNTSNLFYQDGALYVDVYVEDTEGNTMNLYACLRRLDEAWDYDNDWLALPEAAVEFYKGKDFMEIAELFQVEVDEIPALGGQGDPAEEQATEPVASGVGILDYETIAEVFDWILFYSSKDNGYQKAPYEEVVKRMGGVEGAPANEDLWNEKTRYYKWGISEDEFIKLTFQLKDGVWVHCGSTTTTAFIEIYNKYYG